MATVTRNLFFHQLRQNMRHKKFSTAAIKRNEEYVVRSTIPDFVIPNMRILDRIFVNSKSFLDHVAIECAETKKNYTYRQMQKNMAVFATSLHKKLGLKSGDVVAVMLPNCPEFPVIAFGSLQAGCILTTINPIYKEFEISHQIAITEPKVIVTIPECYETVVNCLKQAKGCNVKIVLVDNSTALPDGAIRYSEIAENGEADYALLDKIDIKHDDIALIPFSSGTTGLPKGVDITYKNLLAAVETMSQKEICFPQLTNGTFQDVLPCVLPFFHIYGIVVTLLGHIVFGCKMISLKKFSASLYFDILKNQKPSLLYIVPPIAILLGKHPDVKTEYFQNVRNILCGAAPLSATDAEAIIERCKTNIQFNQGFGTTETTSLGMSTFIGTQNIDYSSCGEVMSGFRVKIVDTQTGETLPHGKQGELYIKSPTVMKGYHKNEKATKDSLTEDGYFKTGDLGYYDSNNRFYITDRVKELIKVKGMQVAPAELEALLRTHPAIAEAAVIGIPHEFYGECPKAFITKKKDVNITSEEIKQFVSDKVASFKRIEEVAFVNDIPKTASGKILRRDLKSL